MSESSTTRLADVARRLSGRVGRGSLGVVVQSALNLAATLYVSRALGAEHYGLFGLGIFFSVQVAQALQWGLQPVVTRDLVRASAPPERILGAVLVQRSAFAVVALVGGLALAATWRGEGGWLLVYLGIVDGVLVGFTLPSAFDAAGRLATYALVAHVRPLGYLAGAWALQTFAPEWLGPRSVLCVHAAALAASVALEWAWIARHHGRPDPRGAGALARSLVREATPLAWGDLAASLLAYASIPALAWLGHAEATGHLNLSNQLAVTLASLAGVPAQALHAHLAAHRDPRSPAFRREVAAWTGALLAAGVATCAIVTVVAPPLVAWMFGPEFAASGELLRLDCWRFAGILGGAALASALACQGRAGLLAACQLLGLAVSVTIAFGFVPGHGASAAAFGSSAGRLAAFAAMAVAVLAVRRRE